MHYPWWGQRGVAEGEYSEEGTTIHRALQEVSKFLLIHSSETHFAQVLESRIGREDVGQENPFASVQKQESRCVDSGQGQDLDQIWTWVAT